MNETRSRLGGTGGGGKARWGIGPPETLHGPYRFPMAIRAPALRGVGYPLRYLVVHGGPRGAHHAIEGPFNGHSASTVTALSAQTNTPFARILAKPPRGERDLDWYGDRYRSPLVGLRSTTPRESTSNRSLGFTARSGDRYRRPDIHNTLLLQDVKPHVKSPAKTTSCVFSK